VGVEKGVRRAEHYNRPGDEVFQNITSVAPIRPAIGCRERQLFRRG
jgi:hypothetical protein